jgi:hypothetical protein
MSCHGFEVCFKLKSNLCRYDPAILLSNAAMAFALNMSVYLLIGKTSALTMNVAGVLKVGLYKLNPVDP